MDEAAAEARSRWLKAERPTPEWPRPRWPSPVTRSSYKPAASYAISGLPLIDASPLAHVSPRIVAPAAPLKFRNPWPGLEAPLMALADHELIDAGRVEVGDFGFDLTEVDDLTFSR